MKALLAGLAVMVCARSASAEDLIPQRLRIQLTGTTARLVARFKIPVEGPGSTSHTATRPPRAVITAGSVTDAGRTHALVLTAADQADAAYAALAEAPPKRARASMLDVSDSGGGPFTFTLLAPRPGSLVLELELAAPTCFDGDKRYVAIPTGWAVALSRAAQGQTSGTDELRARCNDGLSRDDSVMWIGLATQELARRAPGDTRIGALGARFAAGTEQAARVELAIASKLDVVPVDLHTVFVIDASRSLSADQHEAARAVVRSYLAHAPRSSVQVVAFARMAKPLLAKWSAAASASRMIDAQLAALTPANGSDLQLGLREAGSWLQQLRAGTRRVVIISDSLVADRIAKLTVATLASELPAGTLVHVVALDSHGGGLVRDDAARWSSLAAATTGMAMRAGDADAIDALALVRPISLDHVRIHAPSWTALGGPEAACIGTDPDAPLALGEGQSCTWWATSASTAGDSVDVEGMIWGRRWRTSVALGERTNVGFARQLISVLEGESPLAIAALDAARAVSHRWSLVARWGGDGGYGDLGAGGGTGWGAICGCDSVGTIGHGSGTGTARPSIPSLHDQLAPAIAQCLREGATVALTVETTLDEIVDVDATSSAPEIETCVEEAVWATNVRMPRGRAHEISRLTY